MKTLSALFFSMLVSSFAQAAPIPEMTCLNAGGFYGNLAIRQIGLEVDVIGQQGYAYELTEQLGAPKGEEADRVELRFSQYQCEAGAGKALHCQGTVKVVAETYTHGTTTKGYDADLLVTPGSGHVITISLKDLDSGKQAKASVSFASCN